MRNEIMTQDAPELDPNDMSRAELQTYLEGRGFAVYDSEPTEDLREAVSVDLEGGYR